MRYTTLVLEEHRNNPERQLLYTLADPYAKLQVTISHFGMSRIWTVPENLHEPEYVEVETAEEPQEEQCELCSCLEAGYLVCCAVMDGSKA